MTAPGYTETFISIGLALLAIGISRFWKLDAEKDMAIGSVRAFIQLIAVGYALNFIFDMKSPWLILLALAVMIIVGAQAASSKVKGFKGSFLLVMLAMSTGSLLTIGLMMGFDIISFEARYVIPLGGMIIGNSMNASALTIDRICSDVSSHRLAIETSLALGKTWRTASKKYIKSSTVTGMIAILNSLKTIGIVALPGAMTGMILAGAEPLDAVLLQIIVMYMILFAVTVTSVVTVEMTVRRFFTANDQLKNLNC
ncbi:MAG: iron export ABC transporter permease subunit FetB [Calditrichaeota bacterium]|nr:MAG: iron export ABC transporter permease subunit FetB [Calditrichota bacterium]